MTISSLFFSLKRLIKFCLFLEDKPTRHTIENLSLPEILLIYLIQFSLWGVCARVLADYGIIGAILFYIGFTYTTLLAFHITYDRK